MTGFTNDWLAMRPPSRRRAPAWAVLPSICLLAVLAGHAGQPRLAWGAPTAKTPPAQATPAKAPAPKGATPKAVPLPGPRDYQSRHFLIHTDLKQRDARELLGHLENMLELISDYWGHAPPKKIECFVVKDLAAWPPGSLSEKGLAKIRQGAGVTEVGVKMLNGKPIDSEAVVYAVADRGTPQHEAVHAYCGLCFGTTGPLWYAEGMAELGQYWRKAEGTLQHRAKNQGVRCHPEVLRYLRSTPPKPVHEIVADDGRARPGTMGAAGDSWQAYAWRWALCYLMESNPNYSQRFQAFGRALLRGQPLQFEQVFADDLAHLEFEYRYFLQHLEPGYRVDLCRWDWQRKFREPPASGLDTQVAAQRGWQPSGVEVTAGQRYDFSSSGTWKIDPAGSSLTADGGADGAGRMEAVVMAKNLTLGTPFALGVSGQFVPSTSGDLYLRCRDAWSELADNKGMIHVKIKPAAPPAVIGVLPMPTPPAPKPAKAND